MVPDTADDDGLGFEVREDAADVTVEFRGQRGRLEKRLAVLGGKHGVDQDLGKRLSHVVRMAVREA